MPKMTASLLIMVLGLLASTASAQHGAGYDLTICKWALPSCDLSALTKAERAEVKQALALQNVVDCKQKLPSCEWSHLKRAELREVRAALTAQNVVDCKQALPSCQLARLTREEVQEVRTAVAKQNVLECKFGLSSCDLSALTDEQVQEVARFRALQPGATSRPSFVPTVVPSAVGTTGYGEISDETGRPKTVKVRGYVRRDGTYVRPHFRSPPRR